MSSSRVQDAELINKVNYSSIYYQWSTYNSLKIIFIITSK